MPRRRDPRLEQIIQELVDRVDRRQPYARQLEEVAGAAVGYALQHPVAWHAGQPIVSPGLRGQIETAVASFAAPPSQAALHLAAHQAGLSHGEVLAGVVLKHCHEHLQPLTAEQVARYALEFALALAEARPALAEQYRRWLARQ